MADTMGEAAIAARLMDDFVAAGAAQIAPDCLQPADILLDLYGEDIRARTYTAQDPIDGDLMLRPDFTVPVVQAHLSAGGGAALYTYAGPVWRRQEPGSLGAREFWQVGYESLGVSDPSRAEADVFARIGAAVEHYGAQAITGDLGFVLAAIGGLKANEARKEALRRHVWRPGRFERLLSRFAGREPFDCDRRELPVADLTADAPGRRGMAAVAARLEALAEERASPPLSAEEVALFGELFSVKGSASDGLARLAELARAHPSLTRPQEAMARRLDALVAHDIDPQELTFDGGFGRQAMEYYEGFVFAFDVPGNVGPPVATGGRYDALTRALGGATGIPAVGGVVRPGILARLRSGS